MPLGCIIFALACAQPPLTPVRFDSDLPFRAADADGGMRLSIERDTLRIVFPDTPDFHLYARQPAEPIPDGIRYTLGKGVVIDILNRPCDAAGTANGFQRQVLVRFAGKHHLACGGASRSLPRVAAATGAIQSVDRFRPSLPEPTIRFGYARMVGSTGCNRFSATYRVTGATLTLGPIAVTRRACAGEAGLIERRLIAMLRQPLTIRRARGRTSLSTPDSAWMLVTIGDGDTL